MSDHEEELKIALRMSLQSESPEPKRSKPWENERESDAGDDKDSGVKERRTQRELMAAAAEKRMVASRSMAVVSKVEKRENVVEDVDMGEKLSGKEVNLGEQLSIEEANVLFTMLFGSGVTRDILMQWSNQGIRFSSDQETSMGLVQHEGGPCGVLAAIQAFVLKYLLFSPEELISNSITKMPSLGSSRSATESTTPVDLVYSLTEEQKSRALVRSLGEILFMCGSNRRAVIASLSILHHDNEGTEGSLEDEAIAKSLEGLVIESGSDLHRVLRVDSYNSQAAACQRIEAMLPVFRSRMGALLFLISALVSRGLDLVQADRDDPSQSLVTAPFGHASQEIVNLLLSGEAVANVFDGRMDLGGEMFLKGISGNVEVGFLTLLESLNFCRVGQYLKCPKWPIWVVGSESHYTVLFALNTSVQSENEFDGRESVIRRAFDAQDQSGGGGFISVEGFHQLLKETNINLPSDTLNNLTSSGFIVWSEFLQVLMELDNNLGGLKDSTGLMGKKVFEIYHFNGIAKSDLNGSSIASGGETPTQRPRLSKVKVNVPPRWTPEEFMADVKLSSESPQHEPVPPQHAPLVDCIRTRWPRATCNWIGDPPSIV